MELAKLIAACFVVWMHIPFPGRFGELVAYIGSFAVPLFFMLSGYFNYRATCSQILRRAKHIFTLWIAGDAARVAWLAVQTILRRESLKDFILLVLPDQEKLTDWVICQMPILSGHLWYLHAMVVVYLLYWAYVRFRGEDRQNDHPLYWAGFSLFAVYFTMAVLLRPEGEEMLPVYRNAYIMGIPFFTAGIFFREYEEHILSCFGLSSGRLIAIVCVGVLLTVQQWIRCATGMPLGMLIADFALLPLLAQHPQLTHPGSRWEKVPEKCGTWSTWIYIFHVMVSEFYGLFLQQESTAILGKQEEWLRPIFIVMISTIVAMLIDFILSTVKTKRLLTLPQKR